MTPYERQAAEIATIRPRTFKLNLSDADIDSLCEAAARLKTTPAELITGFIQDYVCGTYTHGSDERMYAEQYVDRCCYGLGLPETLLSWAAGDGYCLERLIDSVDDMDTITQEIEYLREHPDETEPDEIESLTLDLRDVRTEIEETYNEYKKAVTGTFDTPQPQDMEQGIDEIRKYAAELQRLKEGE